ncbi:hypothetical protein VD0004_g6154 [Verticillium dahliae]|nr:hypothetical protein VD0004_g6154 [Verticillium dahliae]PNH71614.1 hypothetical protein VD0001_g5925 [Verticillium dahliae]
MQSVVLAAALACTNEARCVVKQLSPDKCSTQQH